MPVNALPEPWPAPLPGTVHLHREWRDALGRPMRGTVTLAGRNGHTDGGVSVPVAPVVVEVPTGVLDVDLPPDTYTYTADLRTVDGNRVADTGTVTLD